MDLNEQRVAARKSALNFVLMHGDELSDDCEALTNCFSWNLRNFEFFFHDLWPRFPSDKRFWWAEHEADKWLREDELLRPLRNQLDSIGLFGWRIELTRFILNYMQDRFTYDHSLGHLIDRYKLINAAIDHPLN
jgi:hypothetical protein